MTVKDASNTSIKKLGASRPRAIGRLFLLARRDFLARVSRHLKTKGLKEIPPQLVTVISYIDIEGTRSTDIADRAGITKQAVGKIVKQLEKEGLLERLTDPSDGRAFLVKLTDASLEHLLTTYAVVNDVEREYERLLGKADMKEFRRMLMLIAYGDSAR